jgi:predicted SnoaL-like aldol condensation-catalyzing enzyme
MNAEQNKQFVRQHFEEFVNRKNLDIANRNFAPEYQEHGADAPADYPPGPDGPKRYLAAAFKRYPDIHVTIEDIIAENDKVVVRNTWRATDSANGQTIEFGGIVIWRIAHGQLVERWAYLQAPHQVH